MPVEILLLEDDVALAMGIEYSLKSEGYEVTHISTFNEGKNIINTIDLKEKNYVGIFDVMLPDGNGFDLLNIIRNMGCDMPVIFLTAMADEINIVQGLDLGADDYITKPFHVKELMSRLKAVIRRYRIGDIAIYYKDLKIDTSKSAVYKINNNEINKLELTQSEYKLLLLFIKNKNVVLERDVILDKIFDSNGSFVDDNTLSVYIKRLRNKLGDESGNKPYIRTVRGIGYIMED